MFKALSSIPSAENMEEWEKEGREERKEEGKEGERNNNEILTSWRLLFFYMMLKMKTLLKEGTDRLLERRMILHISLKNR